MLSSDFSCHMKYPVLRLSMITKSVRFVKKDKNEHCTEYLDLTESGELQVSVTV